MGKFVAWEKAWDGGQPQAALPALLAYCMESMLCWVIPSPAKHMKYQDAEQHLSFRYTLDSAPCHNLAYPISSLPPAKWLMQLLEHNKDNMLRSAGVPNHTDVMQTVMWGKITSYSCRAAMSWLLPVKSLQLCMHMYVFAKNTLPGDSRLLCATQGWPGQWDRVRLWHYDPKSPKVPILWWLIPWLALFTGTVWVRLRINGSCCWTNNDMQIKFCHLWVRLQVC